MIVVRSAVVFAIGFTLIFFGLAGCDDAVTDPEDPGDDSDPTAGVIEISTIDELQLIGNDSDYPLDGDYVLVNDIDASETAEWNDGEGFEPIAQGEDDRFDGTLDGQGFSIDALVINRPDSEDVGLVSKTTNRAEFADLQLRDIEIIGGERNVGGLVGESQAEKISDVRIEGSVEGDRFTVGLLAGSSSGELYDINVEGIVRGERVGGITGRNRGNITRTSAVVEVRTRDGTRSGGLVGNNWQDSEISKSVVKGTVEGERRIGGLVGHNSGTIRESRVDADVSGEWTIGGLAGSNSDHASITDAYVKGSVSGVVDGSSSGGIGGAVGGTRSGDGGGEISGVYVAADVVADHRWMGGLLGRNNDEIAISSAYWDLDKSGQEAGVGEGEYGEYVEGRTTEQMQGDAAEANMTGFDFDDTWQVVEDDYPVLQWENE